MSSLIKSRFNLQLRFDSYEFYPSWSRVALSEFTIRGRSESARASFVYRDLDKDLEEKLHLYIVI